MTEPQQTIEKFKQLCNERGLRVTNQRLEIFDALAHDDSHPSVEDIYKKVVRKIPMISLDTVYRTVATFEQYGLVQRIQTLDNKSRFDSNLDPHHHLVCTQCRRVVDFDWPSFDRLGKPGGARGWSDLSPAHVEMRGVCPECRKQRGTQGKAH